MVTMTTGQDTPTTTNMADDEEAQPDELQPCGVCGRRFNPHSLEKHVKICEKTAQKKRKPFDSAKQRIQGTELAEFLPKHPNTNAHEPHHHQHYHHRRPSVGALEEVNKVAKRPNQAWKQSRDEFLRALRAARGDTTQVSSTISQQTSAQSHGGSTLSQQSQAAHQRPSTLSLVSSQGAPTRSNEKGTCPTCQRQFGVKSYDRHVAFCKERATRLPASPQTNNNVAKERLEARMKYRAPGLRNRRPTNREKYSPGAQKANVAQSPLMARSPMKDAKENSITTTAAQIVGQSSTQKNANGTASPKLPMLKRPGNLAKEAPATPNGPLKSRPIDRSNRLETESGRPEPRNNGEAHPKRSKALASGRHPSEESRATRESRRERRTLSPNFRDDKDTSKKLPRGSPSKRDCVLFDYYRNEAANFSDDSSVRIDDQVPVVDFDDDFAEENESNASSLLKEIKIRGRNWGVHATAFADSEESLLEMSRRSKPVDLSILFPRNRYKMTKCRNVRLDGKTRGETIDIDDPATKPRRRCEKEICTITRLDLIKREDAFLPQIDSRRRSGRLGRKREKSIRSKPHQLRGIVELDTPGTDDNGTEEKYPGGQLFPPINGLAFPDRRSLLRRSFERLPRCDWNSYVHRHPDFSMILRDRIGANKDYNPFLLAEQQLNDLFSDTSDQSSNDGSSICQKPGSSPSLASSHTSAFAKYPANGSSLPNNSQSQQRAAATSSEKQPPAQQRASVIAPPSGFDDLTTSSDVSSDCAETNSFSRELISSMSSNSLASTSCRPTLSSGEHVLGRRVIIDQKQALMGGLDQATRLTRPLPSRSNSLRAASAPKPPERKISSSSSSGCSDLPRNKNTTNKLAIQNENDHYRNAINGSNLSLSSIFSSTDLEMKRSNSLFDELLSSFEDDSTSTLPSLREFMRNDFTILSSAPLQNGIGNGHQANRHAQVNGRINCSDDDGEISSPESVKRQEGGGKLSADSAYSSLNRKYSNNHGRSANDVSSSKLTKLSKFCHECGFKFPDSAKFCCECGVKRLTL